MVKAAGAMILMGIAVGVLALGVLAFGNMDDETIARGGTSVALAILGMVSAMNQMPKEGKMAAAAGAMILMSFSMTQMAIAFALFGMMEWDTLLKGMAGVTVAMGVMVGAMIAIE